MSIDSICRFYLKSLAQATFNKDCTKTKRVNNSSLKAEITVGCTIQGLYN